MGTDALVRSSAPRRVRSCRGRKLLVRWGGLVVFVLAGCRDQGPTQPFTPAPPALAPGAVTAAQSAARFVTGHVLVRFQPGAAGLEIAAANGAAFGREIARDVWVATVAPGREFAAAAALAANPNVVYAEPDFLRTLDGRAMRWSETETGLALAPPAPAPAEDPLCPTCARPSDQFFEWQWNMHNDGDIDFGYGLVFPTGAVDADIDWLEAFDYLGPSPAGSVLIGILDTGIRRTHVDICGKVALEKNFYDGSSLADDDYGHGTHVAGIAAACADNAGGGAVGVAYGPDMQLMAGKVCAIDGSCSVSAIVEGLHWMADNGANVVNMSFGDPAQSQAEADALQYATDAGVLAFCAAGNDGAGSIAFPAADPNCVAVTGTDYGDDLASYSSYGPQAELSAPGGDDEDPLLATSLIWSLWAGWDTDYLSTIGTSMAAPHATGLGALLYALGLTDPADIRACLRSTADDLGDPGWDERFGWGRINMYAAVTNVSSCVGSGGGGGGGEDPPGTVHVADLDGTSQESRGNRWEARATIYVVDDDGLPVAGAQVSASWTGADDGSASVTTGADGSGTVSTGGIRGGSSVTFVVDDIVHPSLTYDADLNTDPDGDSDGTTLTVQAPGEGGGSDPPPPPPPPPPGGIQLTAVGSKQQGAKYVELNWSGATTAQVIVLENDGIIDITENDGEQGYNLGKGKGGTYVYLVCEVGEVQVCSNQAEVSF